MKETRLALGLRVCPARSRAAREADLRLETGARGDEGLRRRQKRGSNAGTILAPRAFVNEKQ
jgi:hypothetical protein